MPCNLYGPNDNFHPTGSHVIPALLRRFHEAKLAHAASVACWGTGAPRREFLYVDDLADACVFLLRNYSASEHVNVGVREDISIKELAETIKAATGFEGGLLGGRSKPDGTMLKRMDVARIHALGWRAMTTFASELRRGSRRPMHGLSRRKGAACEFRFNPARHSDAKPATYSDLMSATVPI